MEALVYHVVFLAGNTWSKVLERSVIYVRTVVPGLHRGSHNSR